MGGFPKIKLFVTCGQNFEPIPWLGSQVPQLLKGPAQGVCTAQGNNALIVKAHSIEDVPGGLGTTFGTQLGTTRDDLP